MQVETYTGGFCSANQRASAVFYDRDVIGKTTRRNVRRVQDHMKPEYLPVCPVNHFWNPRFGPRSPHVGATRRGRYTFRQAKRTVTAYTLRPVVRVRGQDARSVAGKRLRGNELWYLTAKSR